MALNRASSMVLPTASQSLKRSASSVSPLPGRQSSVPAKKKSLRLSTRSNNSVASSAGRRVSSRSIDGRESSCEFEFDANEVYPGLWVGGLSAAQDDEGLRARKIRGVVTMAARLKPAVAWRSPESSSIEVTSIDVEDHPLADILGALPRAIKAIDRVMKKRIDGDMVGVLVHCASGMSRSVAACIAWLMLRKAISLAAAQEMVVASRETADPNFGFIQSLKLLEEQVGEPNQRLKQAREMWQKANKEHERDHAVQKMRKVADALSDRASTLEEMLAQEKGKVGKTDEAVRSRHRLQTTMKIQLEKLLVDIKAAKPSRCIDDNLASSIRDLTAQKVVRLLGTTEARAIDRSQPLACAIARHVSLEDCDGTKSIPLSRRPKFSMKRADSDEEWVLSL